MAWRFKASKYKNAAPIVPKPEMCVRDICVGSYQTYGNNIAASAAFMAFNWEHTGSSLAVLPIDDCGRKSKNMPLLHGHTDTITDLGFSPFHDGLLATGSQDCLVKIWFIPEKGLETSLSNPECTFSHKQRRVETVGFHPTADCLLHSTSAGNVSLWDITAQNEIFTNNEHPEVIQSLSWKMDGTVLATSCKDKSVRILDPRCASPICMVAESHKNIKDSRVVWLGEQTRILTTGFDSARLRQIILRDIRNISTPEKTLELDCSTGILMPLYDPDTNMVFLAGKGDTTISYMEVTDKDPFLIEGLRHNGEQTKGACLVPKRALRVMEGEVNRIMQLTSNSVIPIMYQVPRKTYRDFHSDLYPDTNGYKTDLTAVQWMSGINISLSKISLDPAKRDNGEQPMIIHRGNLNDIIKNQTNKLMKQKSLPDSVRIKETNDIPKTYNNINIHNNNNNNNNNNDINDNIDNKHNYNQNDNIDNNKSMSRTSLIKKFDKINDSAYDCNNHTTKKTKMMMIINKDSSLEKFENFQNFENLKNIDKNVTNKNIDDLYESRSTGNINNGHSITNGSGDGAGGYVGVGIGSVPPKPLPRTSRNNSMSEQGNPGYIIGSSGGVGETGISGFNIGGIIQSDDNNIVEKATIVRPVARPRTTTSYKPRLGPKPFTSVNCSGNISFDNVFSVPQAPGSSESSSLDLIESIENVSLNSPDASEVVTEESLDSLEVDTTGNNEKSTVENDHQHSGNMENTNDMVKSDNNHSLEEDLERAISTAERRKMFENIQTEAEISIENGEDKTDVELKRLSLNRSSIAERRKLYENRSQSVQEEKPQSPLPLLRKDSLKNRNDCSKDMLDDDASKEDNSKIIDELSTTDVVDMKKLINNSIKDTKKTDQAVVEQQLVSTATKRTSTVFGRVSKFRHLKGTPYHKSTHIENIRNVSRQISGECNGFHANHERVAIPIAGPGGKIVIYELSKPGRLPDGVIPSLVNGSNIMDFQWDPFDAYRLAVACDDGIIKLWQIPQDGLSEPTNVCEHEFAAHNDKIYFIRFHPLASDVLLSASYDMTIKLWDLKTMSEKLCLQGHTDQIFDFAWSPCGVYGATVCKDGKIRVFNPRKSDKCMREGIGPVGTRGARLIWAIEGQYIVCTGFDKVSERQISIYKATDLSAPLNTVSLDVTPGILMPFYDEDSSTLFATGRGDTTIYAFEITDEPSYICPLSHHRCSTVHQGLSFLNKNYCDVSNVEFAKALRLTNSTIEPLSFSVPRIKNELFQDDLFPPTKITWMATISSTEWFNMKDKKPKKISLKPEGMESLSAAQTSVPAVTPTKKTDKPPTYVVNNLNRHGLIADYEKAKKDEIQKSMSARMEFTTKLEQDDMEGVDEVEWEE